MTTRVQRAHPPCRPRRRNIRLLVAGCAVAAVVSSVAGCGADAGNDKKPEHRTFMLHGPTLTIDSDDSALEVVPVDGHQVKVTRWFEGRVVLGGDPTASWQWHDDRLSLRMKCSGFISDCSTRHRVEVPRDAAVRILTKDGGVSAHGLQKALKISSEDGSVRVDDCSGPLDVQSDDGSVRAAGITARQVRAVTKDGSIRLDLDRAPDAVSTRSDDGSTEITLPRSGTDGAALAYKVTVTTTDGGREIDVPRDDHSPYRVSAGSQDGKVTVRSAS